MVIYGVLIGIVIYISLLNYKIDKEVVNKWLK
jgi:hypothetical protein